MALQIANPVVVAKIERLARATGLSKTAAVEKAVDRLIGETAIEAGDTRQRLNAILAQFDRLPDLPDGRDPLEWDENGLPK